MFFFFAVSLAFLGGGSGLLLNHYYRLHWDSFVGGERGGGEPGICDGRMPLSTRQTNTVPPKRCDTPCLAQGRPKLRNICMTVRCRSADGQRHRTVLQKALRNRSPPSASPPLKESRLQGGVPDTPGTLSGCSLDTRNPPGTHLGTLPGTPPRHSQGHFRDIS